MKRYGKMHRLISLVLTLVMVIGMMPMQVFATEETGVTETTDAYSINMQLSGISTDAASAELPEDAGYYAACGDSITHANHALVEDINTDDPYYPMDGYSGTTYARKNYAYYIAERNHLQWANYGYGGTTLHHCYPKGYGGTSMRTFPFVDERITQLKEGVEWDYISIFFGYNDAVYGPVQQRDFWLTETYGEELGYPVKDSQIGTEGFANAEQKAACDAATGTVGGVEYTDNTEYFFAKFVGTVDDTETTTFLGAYNYALDYLTKKYPNAKIMIVNPYVSGTNNTRKIIRDGVNAVAEKWGVSCMDFSDLPYWFYRVDQKRVEFPNPHREDGRWYAENGKANFAGTVEGYNRARFTTDGTHPSNLGYQTISKPMERALLDFDNTVYVMQGESFETELILDDVFTGMDISVTMDGTDITDQCYANGKIRIESVTGNVIIRANGNIAYTDGHTYSAEITPPTCTEQGYTTYACECGESYVADYVDALGHIYENGICTGCGAAQPGFDTDDSEALDVDLFVFAGQSNMMGAAVLEPEVNTFTDNSFEYKYMPKLRGETTGSFVPAQNPAGEFYYNDLTAAYGDKLNDLSYKSTLANYSANTYFCPAMRDGVKGFAAQSEANTYPSASLAPYFVTEYAQYGHSTVYAHMAKGAVKIVHYFTEEMVARYNALITEYNSENGNSYSTLSAASLSGAGDAFDAKYNAMIDDYVTFAPDNTVKNKCFVWLQGESDGGSYIEYKLKMQVLWEHLQTLGFSHFFVLRVGYWGSAGVLNAIKAQEDFCAENDNCYIVTRAPSLIPYPTATTDNWWINEPSAEYDNCRDSYLVDSSNNHFNERAMQIFAERSAENIHRILYLGLDPVLEEENIRGMQKEEELPEDDTLYTSYVGTEAFCNSLSVSQKSNVWKETSSSSAASTNLISVSSDDSVWIQQVFFKSDAHAVGGFYDADGQLVAPLWYEDFGFTADPNTGGVTAFRTPLKTNRVSVADVEAATGKKIAYVRFTAWAASEGGHAGTEARIYHEEHTHTYENGICTGCGAEHPNLANYKGKVISILGDSISTFAGYIPVADGFNLQHYARYPQDNLFTDVEHTWWMQMLTALDAKLGINESWRSTEVGNIYDVEVNSGYEGTKACMASTTRIQNLGSNGTPDVILFYGGTNDITQRRTVGTFDPATAPTEVDLTSVKWDTVADAYVAAIMRMQYYYPNAEIVAMLPTFTYKNTDAVIEEYNSVFAAICEHYGVTYVDLRECGISTSDLPDGTHPNKAGMDYITAAVMDILLDDCEVEAGEHIVHSVTHNLTGAESSLSYYKGISHGKPFTTMISGENVVVTVTIGGVDMTAACYTNGLVSIENVTDDVVITAVGKEKTIYDDHLQQLPDELCGGMNLWTVLVPENQYYTGSRWGNLSTGQVWSITIRVAENERIYASSFEKNGSNGNDYSSSNAIRVTWFDADGVLKSLSPTEVYAEFKANGYLTVPADAVAVNIPMWNNSDDNKIYILNRTHTYENGICTGCGATVSPYLQRLPENILGCTDLYDVLSPVKGYYTATKYDTSNGEVLSVVIPVEPGDRIAASSFASKAENMGSVDGIRVTYLLGDKIVTSLAAGDVYNAYMADGYITVPAGVDTVSIPWWKPSDSNWLTLSQISKDFAIHSAKTVPEQAPTCTEKGYTAGEICEICNASLGERQEIPATGHSYSGDTCSVCGAVNLAAILDGKYVSVLGDSISTFNGYSNDGAVNTTIGGNGPRYDAGAADTKPGSYCLLENVNDTWWMDFANRSGMKLLVNNSWAGSQVFGGKTSDGRVIPAAYLDRCVNLHDNTLENNPGNAPINPDVIFVYLGINDYNFNRSKVGSGEVDYAGLVSSDGTYVTPVSFGEAYGIMLGKMRAAYPDARIFAMTLLPENLYSVDKTAWEQHNAYIRAAAEYYGIPVVDLAENCAITWDNFSGYMIDRIHPTTAGMELIADCIETELISYYTENPPHTHSYTTAVTAPTCTEQGYTTYTCECGDSYTSDVVAAFGHDFSQSFVCSKCDHVAKVSVFGDSISTYAGFSAVKNAVYPNKTVQSVEDTWWKQVVDMMGAQLLVNNASGGSRVLSDEYFNGNGIREGNYAAYRDRCVNLHDGDEKPDVIFVFMGTNDFSYHVDSNCEKCQILLNCSECTAREDGNLNVCSKCRSISGIYSSFCNLPLGIADSVNASAEVPASVCEAYAIMLSKMKAAYPNAQIYCMGLLPRVNPYQNATYHDHGQPTAFNAELKKVAENAGARFISLEQSVDNSASTWNTYFGDAVHPTAIGMDKISAAVLTDVLGKEIYAVSSQIVSSAVTMTGESWAMDGTAYEASVVTVNPDLQLDVRVIMNGVDVTENVFNAQTGRIYIAEVTGNILITVKTEGIFWSIGTINTINGADADDYKNRIRTDYISVDEGVTVRASNDAEINVVYFDANYKILSADNNTGWIKAWTSVGAPTAAAYIRVVARATSGTNLTTEYSQNITITCGHVHDYKSEVTAPTCTEQGYTTYTCECGDSYVGDYTDPRPLNILMIGNSFSWDAADFWYDMQTSMTYDAMKSMMADPYDVHLAVMYKGSATLAYHATCAMKNTSAYTYTEIGPETNYRWMPSSGTNASNNILDQLEARDWDIIVIQSYQHEADGTEPRSTYTGGDARFTEPEASVGYLLDYFAEREPNAAVYYYMPWATTKFYGSDTETGYHAMAKYTETTVPNLTGTNSGKSFAGIIPVGTGIQNARTTYFDALRFSSGTGSTALLKDPQNGLQYDSQHLSFGLGRYIAGIIVAETLIPQEMRKDSYVLPTVKDSPAVGELPQEYSVIGQLAAKYALQDPFKLTTLADYDTELADRVCDAIKTADYSANGITGETDLQTHVETVVAEKLENMGAAEYSVTIHSFTLENGQIADMEATVTLRVGYTSRSVEIMVTNGMAHPFGEWEIIAVPSAEGPGLNRRVCKSCGFVEEVEVDGSWQKFALAEHLQMLPDDFCSETNLWDLLEPEKLMINHLGEWVSAGSTVYSVTIPVKPGDKIYANSFDQTDGRKGIQVSFIGDYGIVKTTFSSETYNAFQANGGYLIAPEGAIAVNIPVWNVNADNNTINFLGYDHIYTPAITAPTCTEQGYTTYTCECGDSYVADYVDVIGHKFGEVSKVDDNTRKSVCYVCGTDKIYERLTLPAFCTGEVYVENNTEGLYYGSYNVTDLLGLKDGIYTEGDVTITVDGTNIRVQGAPTKTLYFDLQNGTFGVPDYKRDPGYVLPSGNYRFGLFGEGETLPTACIRNRNGSGNTVARAGIGNFANVTGENFGIPYLYLPVGKTYDFDGTLVLAMGMDASSDGDVPNTKMISGNGIFEVNNYLWSLDTDIAVFGTTGSRDTGKIKYSSGAKEYINVYLPREVGYLQIQMNLVNSISTNAFGWRLNMMYACDNNLNQIFPITSSGEYEAAIQLDGRPDFMGMGAHGSEQMTSFTIYVDGTQTTLEALAALTDWSTIRIQRESDFYDPLDETTLVATHSVIYDFDLSGLTVTQDVKWLTDATCISSYMMMFPVRRTYNELQITDTFYDNADAVLYDVSEAGFNTSPVRWTAGASKMTLYSRKSGITASMESLETMELTGSNYRKCANSASYNKLYFTICGASGAKHTVTAGDQWHTRHRYEVEIAQGADCSSGHTYENGVCTGCGAKEPVSHIPGDITGDGELNNKDVTRLFKYLSGYDVEVDEAALDVNGDGEVNNKDVTRLFRYLSGFDVTIH